MAFADQKRAIAPTWRQSDSEAQTLAAMHIDKAKIDAQRKHAEADAGPVRYLAEFVRHARHRS